MCSGGLDGQLGFIHCKDWAEDWPGRLIPYNNRKYEIELEFDELKLWYFETCNISNKQSQKCLSSVAKPEHKQTNSKQNCYIHDWVWLSIENIYLAVLTGRERFLNIADSGSTIIFQLVIRTISAPVVWGATRPTQRQLKAPPLVENVSVNISVEKIFDPMKICWEDSGCFSSWCWCLVQGGAGAASRRSGGWGWRRCSTSTRARVKGRSPAGRFATKAPLL